MFDERTYVTRREALSGRVGGGIILLPGNDESPMNYGANVYPFRQDSSFLYFFGLAVPALTGVIDIDEQRETVYGDEATMEDTIWAGPTTSLAERAESAGVRNTRSRERLVEDLGRAVQQGRSVHILPQYRADNMLVLARIFEVPADRVNGCVSVALQEAVVGLRSVKSDAEIAEMDRALELTGRMHRLAMQLSRPGRIEREVVARIEGLAAEHGSASTYPIIFSRRGEVLHNQSRDARLEAGDMVLCDAGAASPLGYAGDVTRTFPVSGTFTQRQRELYAVVLDAQKAAIEAVRPGVRFRDIHCQTARRLVSGLRDLGLMRGDVDAAVAAGAHALFFPHGLGHMLGLDVHDMEAIGEDRVGYDDEITRSDQFGLANLRLGRQLEAGFVVTIEPGLYFIPGLIDQWQAERRHEAFIDYAMVARYRDAGGIRIEDDVVVLANGQRILGDPIAKEIDAVEKALAQ